MLRIARSFLCLSAVLAAGCTTSHEVSASKDRQIGTARAAIGNALVGAQGRTAGDQDKIDRTAARLCGAGVWTPAECARHQVETTGK